MIKTLRLVALVMVLAMALALAGCQSIAEKATEKVIEDATGVKVDEQGDSVTLTGEDGTSITASESGELPEGFPEDAPVYEGAIITSLVSEDNYTIGIETDDEWTDAWEFYGTELEAAGWVTGTEMKLEDSGMISGEKDGRIIQITVGPASSGEAKTLITLFTGPKS